jgi:hypothetical protein
MIACRIWRTKTFEAIWYKRPVSGWRVQKTMDSLKELANRGAVWKPDLRRIEYLRRDLYRADPKWRWTSSNFL